VHKDVVLSLEYNHEIESTELYVWNFNTVIP